MLEPTLAEQLARAAVTADRSVSAEIRHALRLHLLGTSVPQVTSPTAYEKRRIT
ncbi:MAG TPA: hypothetical protein VMN39_00405 [Longimicrobiaceae bacterium]|nr:hypothetical protein [Longimicrobiaceae bacterium]